MKVINSVEKCGIVKGHKSSNKIYKSIFKKRVRVYGYESGEEKNNRAFTERELEEIEREYSKKIDFVNQVMKQQPGKFRKALPAFLADVEAEFDINKLLVTTKNHFWDCLNSFQINVPEDLPSNQLMQFVRSVYPETETSNQIVFIAVEGLLDLNYVEQCVKGGRYEQAIIHMLRLMPRYALVAVAPYEPSILLGLSTKVARRKSAESERKPEINEILRKLAKKDDVNKNLWVEFFGELNADGFAPRETEDCYFYRIKDKEESMKFSTFCNKLGIIRNPKKAQK